MEGKGQEGAWCSRSHVSVDSGHVGIWSEMAAMMCLCDPAMPTCECEAPDKVAEQYKTSIRRDGCGEIRVSDWQLCFLVFVPAHIGQSQPTVSRKVALVRPCHVHAFR